ncbi:MAG: DUF3685 domain-containing protein [Gloeocapsa sp. UFS-A4-WI-NPMV-4B04]|jgi:DNA-binding NarL/FixJ family response regulator|nr:DUF3685 domain-containing protein [Gloeocapsa sp. UFS-A4-WI-NPMV-4B04]
MSDRPLELLLVDPDPIFRTGLCIAIEQFPDLKVAAQAESSAAALQILAELSEAISISTPASRIDLVVLDLYLDQFQLDPILALQFCRQLKTQYPNLPILLFSSILEPTHLKAAQQAGVNGYCPKGISVSELVAAMRQVATGRSYWIEARSKKIFTSQSLTPGVFSTVRNQVRLSGLQQIDTSLAEVTAQLQIPGLPLLDRAFLAGQRRELLASRWLVNQLLAAREIRDQGVEIEGNTFKSSGLNEALSLPISRLEISSQSNFKSLQAELVESTLAKLEFSLQNLTDTPLEIDIFREGIKRELLKLIIQKIKDILNELRFSQVDRTQLVNLQLVIVRDLWQAVITDFFGKYSTLQVGDVSGKGSTQHNVEFVNILLQDAPVVQTAILNKIPLVVHLFSYLLFETPLVIDNVSYPANSLEARERAELIFQNLIIQVANGVAQPLINKFADVASIKQNFYDRRLISTREIEQFRNNLSWKYRLNNYINEPKAIFESRYKLFVLASRGIAQISIYASRNQELIELSGIQLLVTLGLETRDAIAPRLRAAVAFLGSGVVYILTQVIGRAIGLVGRGIIQGIGGSFPENKYRRNSEKPK